MQRPLRTCKRSPRRLECRQLPQATHRRRVVRSLAPPGTFAERTTADTHVTMPPAGEAYVARHDMHARPRVHAEPGSDPGLGNAHTTGDGRTSRTCMCACVWCV